MPDRSAGKDDELSLAFTRIPQTPVANGRPPGGNVTFTRDTKFEGVMFSENVPLEY
jgi:hypothetical protein